MIRILVSFFLSFFTSQLSQLSLQLFSLVISLALGLPQLSGRPGAVAAPVFPQRAGLEHEVVRRWSVNHLLSSSSLHISRSPEEPAPESEPEAGDEAEAEGEPEPESESTDWFDDNNIFITEIYISYHILKYTLFNWNDVGFLSVSVGGS